MSALNSKSILNSKALRYFVLSLPLIIAGIMMGKTAWIDANKIMLPTGESINKEDLRSRKVLKIIADQVNKQLPMSVGKEMELRRVEGLEGELVYHYVRANTSSDQFDSKQFMDKMRPLAIDLACNSPDMRVYFANGVNARYSFSDNNNQLIGEILVTPKECTGK